MNGAGVRRKPNGEVKVEKRTRREPVDQEHETTSWATWAVIWAIMLVLPWAFARWHYSLPTPLPP